MTDAQIKLLREIARKGHITCSERFMPAQNLANLGYANFLPGRYGQGRLEITDAGRAALASEEHS